MVDRFYGYQSETSPREIQPEYRPYRNTYQEKRTPAVDIKTKRTQVKRTEKKVEKIKKTPQNNYGVKKSSENNQGVKKLVENNQGVKKSIKPRVKLLMLMAVGFSILFTISYRNSIINESFSKKESLKSEVNSVQKTNEQLQVSIENSLNLNNVEQEAKERVGMQKLSNNQKIYVNLEKRDYVESATEEVIMEDEKSFMEKIITGFTKSI